MSEIDPFVNVFDLNADKLYDMYIYSRKLANNAYNYGIKNNVDYSNSGFKDNLQVYKKKYCPFGHPVIKLSEDESPDKRITYWVKEIQRPSISIKKKCMTSAK